MREKHVIKMAAFAAACCCLVAVATALLCAVNSVQPGPYMVRTAMTPRVYHMCTVHRHPPLARELMHMHVLAAR